ncbi:hypothetical protein [Methylobacterium sp. WCS2018Hpa-22]|uniref:hypothetical protein n=1 Tax=Methylobacterium sp. WCS2018Hpa-22 TaxID=3073633 RepID=UPI002889522E|nr:hypothetical protein [Methylobacterium sp. WCS2018Hpa-22]
MSSLFTRINAKNQGDTVSISLAFALSPSGRERLGETGFKIWEPAKPGRLKGSGKAKGSVGLNTLIITDFQKLIAGRRGLGPWNLAIAEAIFDDAAPRIIRGAKTAKKDANAKLQAWSQKWLPELVEAKGLEWVEERYEEIRDEKTGSFRTMDQIAKRLTVTQDEVLGFTLYSLVAHDRPKALRDAENKQADAAKHKANRVANGATPRELSKSRLKPWDAAGVSRATYYREQAEMKAKQARETDSSVTVRSTCKGSDETVSQTDLARNSISVEAVQAVAEPLILMSEDRIQSVIAQLRADADRARAEWVSCDPFFIGIDNELSVCG